MSMREKGSASGIVIGVIALVLVVLIVGGIYAYNNPAVVETASNTEASSTIVYVASTTTSYISTTTTTQVLVPRTPNTGSSAYIAPKPQAKQTALSYSGYSNVSYANSYHNATFGLTIPGNYSASSGQDTYGGISDTASLHLYYGGAQAFQVNVWSREAWSRLRNEETWNNTNGGQTYFGEGTYLGENFNWIYSIIPGSYAPPTGIKFY